MRQLTIEPGEKKPIAYCECCDKPLYKGDKVFKHYIDYYCSSKCLLIEFYHEQITLGE